MAAMSGVVTHLLSAVTTGTSAALATPPSFRNHTFFIKPSNGTFSTGAVTCEASDDPTDANTWFPLAAATTLVSATDAVVNVTGIFPFVRARVSTGITGAGGNVTVDYVGAKSY